MYKATPELIAKAAQACSLANHEAMTLPFGTPEQRAAVFKEGDIKGWLYVAKSRGETRLSLDSILNGGHA